MQLMDVAICFQYLFRKSESFDKQLLNKKFSLTGFLILPSLFQFYLCSFLSSPRRGRKSPTKLLLNISLHTYMSWIVYKLLGSPRYFFQLILLPSWGFQRTYVIWPHTAFAYNTWCCFGEVQRISKCTDFETLFDIYYT